MKALVDCDIHREGSLWVKAGKYDFVRFLNEDSVLLRVKGELAAVKIWEVMLSHE